MENLNQQFLIYINFISECNIIADVTLIDFHEIIAEQDSNAVSEDEFYKHSFQAFLNEAKQHHINGSDEFKKGETMKAIKR